VPVGAADAAADKERAARQSGADDDDAGFVNADMDAASETDAGVPVGRADAEEDRRRAESDDSDSD